MSGRRITTVQWDIYRSSRAIGKSMATAAKDAKISYSSAKSYEEKAIANGGAAYRQVRLEMKLEGPLQRDELSKPALKALDDFEYFRLRYLGHVSSPWQIEAAYRAKDLLETPHKEFCVVNCPPGSGKSTLFVHDIPAWLTAQNRGIRGIIGSRTARQAEMYTARLRRTFERTIPVQAKDDERARGLAVDAQATLAEDYGRFKPLGAEMWTREQFVVAQLGNQDVSEKEPTWTAFGMDSGSLGWRVNYIAWDDVVDKSTIRNIDSIEKQREWWDDEAETRLEPGGVLMLQGQRLSANDLYRYCLDKPAGDLEDLDELPEDFDQSTLPRKYHHIVYRAHYEDRCEKIHAPGKGAKPFPDGCLLDPFRLPWRELAPIKASGRKFAVVYQQEDLDDADVLVPAHFITGDATHPGCWDNDRGIAELPAGLAGEVVSVITCDPSPTRFWAIEWWGYHPASEQRFLLDLVKQQMDAPDFLDWDYNNGRFSGLLEEWVNRAKDLNLPVSTVIVESNAAQRFMLQYDHVRRWMAARSVRILPHETHRNKSHPEFGVQSIAPHFEFGRVRLPGKRDARIASMKLVEEVTRWPEGSSDDATMAYWFLEWNLNNVYTPQQASNLTLRRPSWMRGRRPVYS